MGPLARHAEPALLRSFLLALLPGGSWAYLALATLRRRSDEIQEGWVGRGLIRPSNSVQRLLQPLVIGARYWLAPKLVQGLPFSNRSRLQ